MDLTITFMEPPVIVKLPSVLLSWPIFELPNKRPLETVADMTESHYDSLRQAAECGSLSSTMRKPHISVFNMTVGNEALWRLLVESVGIV